MDKKKHPSCGDNTGNGKKQNQLIFHSFRGPEEILRLLLENPQVPPNGVHVRF